MTTMTDDTRSTIKAYILEELLAGANPDELTDSTPLITSGILDSLGTLKIVAFLEERYEIEVEAHEASVDYLDTVADIAELVETKRASQA